MLTSDWKKTIEKSKRIQTMLYKFNTNYAAILKNSNSYDDFITNIRKSLKVFDNEKSLSGKFASVEKLISIYYPHAKRDEINILDIGTETRNTYTIAKKILGNVNFSGINVAPEVDYGYSDSIRIESPPIWFKWYDGVNIPFEKNSQLIITLFWVLHHVTDLDGLIKEIYRVIAPGGLIVIRDHNFINDDIKNTVELEHDIYGDSNSIVKLYSMDAIVNKFKKYKFKVAPESEYIDKPWNYHAKFYLVLIAIK